MALPDLSQYSEEELDQLIAAARFLKGSREVHGGLEIELLHNVLATCIGPACPRTIGIAKKTRDWSKFAATAPAVIEDIQEGFRPKNLQELQKALRICVEMLIDDLKHWDTPPPITYRVVVNNLARIPAVIDAAFPGYRESGALGPFVLHAPVV